jgi:hypothetical protein
VEIEPPEFASGEGTEEADEVPAVRRPRRDLPGPARRRTLRLLPYAISRPRLERAIRTLRANARLVESVHEADLVVTLKSQEKRLPRPLRERPIHLLRGGTLAQVESFLRDACDLPDGLAEQQAALREVDHAAHTVLDHGAAVELAPQRAYVRHLQHEAAQRLGLTSASRGEEPLRRVVILPG